MYMPKLKLQLNNQHISKKETHVPVVMIIIKILHVYVRFNPTPLVDPVVWFHIFW